MKGGRYPVEWFEQSVTASTTPAPSNLSPVGEVVLKSYFCLLPGLLPS